MKLIQVYIINSKYISQVQELLYKKSSKVNIFLKKFCEIYKAEYSIEMDLKSVVFSTEVVVILSQS